MLSKKKGSSIMYINTTYQSIIQELLFFISHYYEEVKLLALNNGGTLNYLYLRDFSGIERGQLDKLRDNLTDLINKLPSLGRHLNVHNSTFRKKYQIIKKIDPYHDIQLFVTSMLTESIPSYFINKVKLFQNNLKRSHTSEILEKIESSLANHNYDYLHRIHEDISESARNEIKRLGFIYQDNNIVENTIQKYKNQIGGIFVNNSSQDNHIYSDEHNQFKYSIPFFKIESQSVLNEIYRYLIVNDFKKEINQEFQYFHLRDTKNKTLTYSHMFPKWIMSQTKYTGDFDPVIPFTNHKKKLNNEQLIEDISNIANISIKKASEIVQRLNLDLKCTQMIEKLFKYQTKTETQTLDVNTFEYQHHGTHYVKFHTSFHQSKKEKYTDFVFSLAKKRYDFLFNKYKQRHNLGFKSEPGTDFNSKCFILCLRYYMLESYNQQLAVPPQFYNFIMNTYNANMELFASSINTSLINYCSLFPDIESEFGSRGSFWNLKIIQGMYTANPPFSNDIMEKMAHKMIDSLDKSKHDLGFIVTIPAWDKDEHKYGIYKPLHILKKCSYLVSLVRLPKSKAVFYDYLLNKKINPCDMCVILLQNKLSREKYRINLEKDIQKHWK